MNRQMMAGATRWLIAATAAVLMAGCAFGPQIVRTQVTSYNEWATLPVDRSFAFSRTLEYQSSLELKTYEEIVRDELTQKGFKYVPEASQANLIVTLRPSSTTTRLRVRDPWADPFWSPYGGFYGRRAFGGWYDPYWSAFDSFNTSSIDVVHRRLEMDIDSKATIGKRFYEGRVETSSDADSFKAVVPYLVQALFADFPGNNGQTRQVDVPLPRK